MKKISVSLATIAMFFVAVNNANAATCTWNGTKLTITGSGSETFTGCSDGSNHRNATEVTFSSGITSVGNNAFSNATSLQSVSLGGVTSVGYNAFYGNTSLNSVSMPNVTNIGSSAFYNATSLNSVSMPNVTNIDYNAFYNATSLTSVDMPNVTNIGSSAFRYTSSLTSVDMPNIQRIESGAFGYATSLAELNLPSSLTYVGGDAFWTRGDITLIFSGSLSGWNQDALNDYGSGRTYFKCIGDQDACRAEVDAFMSRATYTNASYVDAYDQDGTQYCYTGQVFGNGSCNYCGNKVTSCHWDDGVVIDGCRSGYGVINGSCGDCGSQNAASCHIENGNLIIDSCREDSVFANGSCHVCSYPKRTCEWDGSKMIATSCYNGYMLLIDDCKSCNNSICTTDGDLTYLTDWDDNHSGCFQYVIDEDQKAIAKTTCDGCRHGHDKTDCTTEFYDDDGNIIAEYDDNNQPVAAYDYDDYGNTLVYDDQCFVKEKLDPTGGQIYGFGDSLNGTRRVKYTPAEAAAIVGDSNDNMIVMYFK